jgi:hypothetical protein
MDSPAWRGKIPFRELDSLLCVTLTSISDKLICSIFFKTYDVDFSPFPGDQHTSGIMLLSHLCPKLKYSVTLKTKQNKTKQKNQQSSPQVPPQVSKAQQD